MTENKVRDMRIRANLSQEQVADSLPDGTNRVIVGFIESGRVLPTAETMKSICDLFICSPTDLYNSEDLDLTLQRCFPGKAPTAQKTTGGGRGPGHEGMTEFRVWVKPEEKDALERAIAKLGYRTSAEWFREAYRALLEKYTLMCISENGGNISTLQSLNRN